MLAGAGLCLGKHVLNQRGEHRFVHRRKPYPARIQTLQLSLGERVEIHTRRRVARAHRLSPTQQDFRVACRGDGAFAQTTFDLRVRRRLTISTRCASVISKRRERVFV